MLVGCHQWRPLDLTRRRSLLCRLTTEEAAPVEITPPFSPHFFFTLVPMSFSRHRFASIPSNILCPLLPHFSFNRKRVRSSFASRNSDIYTTIMISLDYQFNSCLLIFFNVNDKVISNMFPIYLTFF